MTRRTTPAPAVAPDLDAQSHEEYRTVTDELREQYSAAVIDALEREWWEQLLTVAEESADAVWVDGRNYDHRVDAVLDLCHKLRWRGVALDGYQMWTTPATVRTLRDEWPARDYYTFVDDDRAGEFNVRGTTYDVRTTPHLSDGQLGVVPEVYSESPGFGQPFGVGMQILPAADITITVRRPGTLDIEVDE